MGGGGGDGWVFQILRMLLNRISIGENRGKQWHTTWGANGMGVGSKGLAREDNG